MYASLLTSLFIAFVAMSVKQWANQYLHHPGRSLIERCGNRQYKCDELGEWSLRFKSLVSILFPILQFSLSLLVSGFTQHMSTVSLPVARMVFSLSIPGILFYLGTTIIGASSDMSPVRSPLSGIFRLAWKWVRDVIASATFLSKRALTWIQLLPPHQLTPTIPLADVQVRQHKQLLELKELELIRMVNAVDVGCVSWILSYFIDPEILNPAFRLAGMIRWFVHGSDVRGPYRGAVSVFGGCFDPNGKLYPGARDKAYHSGRVIVWIHTLAMCGSEDFTRTHPLPGAAYETTGLDDDLRHLLLTILH